MKIEIDSSFGPGTQCADPKAALMTTATIAILDGQSLAWVVDRIQHNGDYRAVVEGNAIVATGWTLRITEPMEKPCD